MDGKELPDMLVWWDNWQHTVFPASEVLLVKTGKNYSIYSCLMHFKNDFMLHYDVGCKHIREHKDLMVWQRLWCKLKTFTCLLQALPHGTDPQPPHLLVIPTEMSTYRREGSIVRDRKDSKPGEYTVQAPSGMEGARSFWQNHLSCIRLLLSVQRGGNESSALFCTPTPTEATGSERERDAGEGAETHALRIIAAWKLLYSPVCDPNKKKSSDNLHHWLTCTK